MKTPLSAATLPAQASASATVPQPRPDAQSSGTHTTSASAVGSATPLRKLWAQVQPYQVGLTTVLALLAVAALTPAQGAASAQFMGKSIAHIFPFLLLSAGLAAWAKAANADNLIAAAFSQRGITAVLLAAGVGALSPFCSCGVIPIVVALLSMGVPLAPVMAFWLASPLMDPAMFVMTAQVLGLEFAIAKTLAAIAMGLFGGMVTLALSSRAWVGMPLREGVGSGGCAGNAVRKPKPVVWKFWHDAARRTQFSSAYTKQVVTLAQWLMLAFFLESLLVAFVPTNQLLSLIGGNGWQPIAMAVFVGVPAYLNGYAALPLVGNLIGQGMAPGAGMAFLVAGGVTSIPAAMAVFAVTNRRVFALYLALATSGALAVGLTFNAWKLW
jgi:uncharacterized protein